MLPLQNGHCQQNRLLHRLVVPPSMQAPGLFFKFFLLYWICFCRNPSDSSRLHTNLVEELSDLSFPPFYSSKFFNFSLRYLDRFWRMLFESFFYDFTKIL